MYASIGFCRSPQIFGTCKIFNNFCLKINIVKINTDVYKEGHELCIARTHGDTCPVHTLEEYLILLGVEDYFYFKFLTFCENTNIYKF